MTAIKSRKWEGAMMVGVPPPKWTCRTGAGLASRSATRVALACPRASIAITGRVCAKRSANGAMDSADMNDP